MFLSNAKLLQTKKILIKGYASGRRKTIKKERERERINKKKKRKTRESRQQQQTFLYFYFHMKKFIFC